MKKWLSVLLVLAFLVSYIAPLNQAVHAATEDFTAVEDTTEVVPAEEDTTEVVPTEEDTTDPTLEEEELPGQNIGRITVLDCTPSSYTSAKRPEMRTLDANGIPAIKTTPEVEWIDRLETLPAFAMDFYNWLIENSDNDGKADALIDPTTAESDGGMYIYEVEEFESCQASFSYSSSSTLYTAANDAMEDAAEKKFKETKGYILAVLSAFDRDHTEVFWLDGTAWTNYSYERSSVKDNKNGTGVVTYDVSVQYILQLKNDRYDIDCRAPEYQNISTIRSTIQKRDNWINEITKNATGTRYQQIKYLNNWLTTHNAYNTSYDLDSIYRDARNGIAALEGRVGLDGPVCESYARAFKMLCNKLGIPCVLVDGTAVTDSGSGGHMWNYVQMDNGKWYAVDVTWNDPGSGYYAVSGSENENYLLVGSQTVIGSRTFIQSHPVSNDEFPGYTCFTNGPVLSTTKYDPDRDKTVTSIAISSNPTKTSYWVGESLNTSGLALTVYYSNGTTGTVTNGFTTTGFDSSTAGTKTVTVTYGGKSVTFKVTVTAVAISKIAIKSLPNKTTYWVGESLDTTGLTLTVTYNNGTTGTVTSGFSVSGFSSVSAGTKTVTVTYSGKTTTFQVTVKDITVTQIAVKTQPTKVVYVVGEGLDTSGLTLTVTYSDGSSKTVNSGFTVSGFSSSTVGTKTVTVSYGGKTTTFQVTVSEVTVTGIVIKSKPTKLEYWIGESLNTAGLSLTVNYSNGTSKTVTSGFNISGFDSSTAGTKTVTVTYGGKTATFQVTIKTPTVTGIKITTQPKKMTYWTGEALDTTGMVLTVTYSDGSTKTITSGFTTSGFSSTKAGTKTITVTYEGKTATFTVTVKEKTALTISTQPKSVVVQPGNIATFTVSAKGEGLTYQWKYKNPGADSFINTSMEGNKTATLTVSNITETHNGRQYLCVITDSFGEKKETNAATLQVAYFVTDAKDQTAEEDSNATFSVKFSITSGVKYQWQYRTSASGSWSNSSMTGDTTNTLTVPAAMKRNGYQYRCKITVSDLTIYSRAANLKVVERPSPIVTQPTSTTAKVGDTAAFTVGTQGEGITYQWKYRKTATGTWTNVTSTIGSGYKTATLKISSLKTSHNGWQFKCVVRNAYEDTAETEVVTLRVAYIKTDAQDQTAIDKKKTVFAVDFSLSDGVVYQWQYRTSAADSWRNTSMTGATTNALTVEAIKSRNGYQYRCQITVEGLAEPMYSQTATLTVNDRPPMITTQPESVIARVGDTVTFTVGAQGDGLTYKWQYRNAGATSWSSTTLTGYNTATLTVANVNAGHQDRQYRCVITDIDNVVEETKAATLQVAYFVTDAKNQTVEERKNANFSVAFSLTEGVTYQWQYRSSTEADWAKTSMTGATTNKLTVAANLNRNGYQYRCKVTVPGLADPVYSKEVTLTVTKRPSAITSQPQSVTARLGDTATFTVGTRGDGLTYQWKYKNPGAESFVNTSLPGSKTNTLTVSNLSNAHHGRQYMCVITAADGFAEETEAATLQVAYIITDAKSQTLEEGKNATFSVVFSVNQDVTYQWQFKSAAENAAWANTSMTGAKTDTLTVGATAGRNGYQYRCKISVAGLADPIYSKEVTLTVTERLPMITAQPKDVTAAIGDTVTFTVGTRGDGLTYQWKYRSPGAESFANTSLPGNKTNSLTVSGLTNGHHGRQYLCVVTDADGNVEQTVAATLQVAYIITDAKSRTAEEGENAIFSVVFSLTEGVTYQWQFKSAAENAAWANTSMTGAKTNALTVGATLGRNGYQYRCKISVDGMADPIYSKEVTLTVTERPSVIVSQPKSVTAQPGDTVTFTVGTQGTGLTYKWQYRNAGVEKWSNTSLSGYKTPTLTVANVTSALHGRQYRCVITDSYGNVVETEPATLNIPYLAKDATSQSVRIGETAIFSVDYTVEDGVKFQWQYKGNTASSTWANTTAAGNKTECIQVLAKATNNRYMYRCKITLSDGTEIMSKEVYLNVVEESAKIIAHPSNQSGVAGTTVVFTVTAEGNGLNYQWQWSDDGVSWSNTKSKGYNTNALSIKTNNYLDGRYYRCVVKTPNGSAWTKTYSEPAVLTVLPAAEITAQPRDVAVKAGGTAVFQVKATGEGLSYQWQWAKSLGNWMNTTLPSATTDTLTITNVTKSMNGRYYRVIITNKYSGSVTTEYARLVVQ